MIHRSLELEDGHLAASCLTSCLHPDMSSRTLHADSQLGNASKIITCLHCAALNIAACNIACNLEKQISELILQKMRETYNKLDSTLQNVMPVVCYCNFLARRIATCYKECPQDFTSRVDRQLRTTICIQCIVIVFTLR